MGHDNITKLGSLLVKLHKGPSSWLCLHPRPDRTSNGGRIKLVRSDGSLQVYDRPVVVSELTKDFPKHKICRSDLLYIGQKTPVLSETETLKLGLNYFLLPSDFFKNDLSFLTIATLKTPQNGGVLVKKTQQQPQPFLIQKGEKGERLRIRVSEEFVSELMMEGKKNRVNEEEEEEEGGGEGEGRVCTTVKLKKDYVQLVGLRRWKPKLETITETKAMKAATMEKTKKKRKRFTVMKKKSQSDSSSKRKLQSKSKSKTKKSIMRKID
ncbi:Hypothetical protein [Arabidopsis thaliana]|jgi:hypothetical protein|uniref:F3H9.15 protein n=2 Tax=Arabidopsis thaliana TaxID=3702 RepID=Q9FZ93_ARATH|nr:uncharacterized protein AT1G28190 [Arabidopsis thaliana]AAF98436.1 Hypothetical protein [Arabidopsis thaliana]AEE30929.1 hypothetical protein AT1G28190 [Arabidopsis thaliana]CAA0249782.1 unnamed protein product [Arabidopsis thaliana]CAD5313891.1 unnamed protein product [Arabidopsis thaliana]|eukprot:NP_174140.1 hypothetical protein AT1G28190 [Arabidopsis thaliana]